MGDGGAIVHSSAESLHHNPLKLSEIGILFKTSLRLRCAWLHEHHLLGHFSKTSWERGLPAFLW
jgi:hypothetical protein